MKILESLLNQTCVYWPKGAVDRFGKTSPGTPVELPCKWQSALRRVVTREGTTYDTTASVYLSSEVLLGGWLWLGELSSAPDSPPNTQQIKNVSSHPDTENEETLWIASV